MTRAFHILVSLLVAIPMGAGGLCCCVLGPAQPADPVRSCCSAEPAPSEACPAEETEQDCGCPVRDTALVALDTGAKQAPLPVPIHDEIVPRCEVALVSFDDELSYPSAVPRPPPKQPLYRTLSALLC